MSKEILSLASVNEHGAKTNSRELDRVAEALQEILGDPRGDAAARNLERLRFRWNHAEAPRRSGAAMIRSRAHPVLQFH
jgi:hypothetical protein